MSRTIVSLVLIVSVTLTGCAAFARGTDDDSNANVDNSWVIAQRRADAQRAAEAREQWLARHADPAPTDPVQ